MPDRATAYSLLVFISVTQASARSSSDGTLARYLDRWGHRQHVD
jgi:hypothetical protein